MQMQRLLGAPRMGLLLVCGEGRQHPCCEIIGGKRRRQDGLISVNLKRERGVRVW